MAQVEVTSRQATEGQHKSWIPAVAASICGVAAFVLAYVYLSSQGSEITLLKVTAEIPVGSMVENKVKPVTFFAKDSVELKSVFVYKEIGETFLHIPVAETLVPGQLLTQRSFRVEGNNRLPLRSTERAISMVVREDSMAALCFVGPGSSIDVWIISDGGAAVKLLSGATLLALGDTASTTRPGQCQDQRYRQITVAVPEADVKDKIQALQLARGGVSIAIVGGGVPPQDQMH